MKGSEILSHVDHTLLAPTATWQDIKALCDEAITYHTASVCIPASYVKRVKDAYDGRLKICTVIGFPLGYDAKETKLAAMTTAIEDGADEIDAVINIGDAKNGDFDKITDEIKSLRKISTGKIFKVIIETCYLTDEEKICLCQCVTDGGADYIKTSTGFGTKGATHDDVRLMRTHIGKNVKIKAAGGIRTIDDMKKYLAEGCDRLGCSAAVKLLKDKYDEEV
ncbi:MAG: deoxyribose-phosphate aldolase [Selenomonadaceae bacterium]